MALASCGSGGPSGSPTSEPPSTTTTAPAPSTSATAPPAHPLGSYVPLFPFTTIDDVLHWQHDHPPGDGRPWQLDAGKSALAFARWLGYTNVDTVTELRLDGTGAHVAIGYVPEERVTRTATAAVVHLVRWGNGAAAPWEVVGTDDTTFSLLEPVYGSIVASPLTVGGRISGVDESIDVQVRTVSSLVGTRCCLPAGGTGSPWRTTVAISAPSGAVLTVAAATGGHVVAVERFTVTGVRLR